jgi:modulator of FtsH protease HflK
MLDISLGIFKWNFFVIERLIQPVQQVFTESKNRILWAIHAWVHRPVYMQEGASGPMPGQTPGQTPNEPGKEDKKSADAPKTNPEDGPPDLDELWKDFNRRLGGLFGGNAKDPSKTPPRSPSNNGQTPPRMNQNSNKPEDLAKNAQDWLKRQMNNGGGNSGGEGNKGFGLPNIGLGLIGIGLFVIWLLSGIFIVQEGQAGIVLQFGKYSYTTRPGINWRLPYPIQTHEVVNVSNVRSVEIGRSFVIQATNLKDSSMLTEDENIIDVKFAVQYRLKDPTDYLFNNRDPDGAVIQAAETAVREIVGRSKMDDVLYVGREKIGIDLTSSIQKILDSYKAGIFITSVNVQNVQPPEQVQAAFDDAVKAGQDQERQKNEGQAYANDVVPRAKGAAARLIEEAQGYKAKVIATAQGDASRFKQIYAEYSKAPQVTRDRMYIDMMQQVYNNVTKVMVDTHGSNQMLYLPLDKLIQQATPANDAGAGSGSKDGSSQVQPPSGSVTVPLNPSSNLGINSVPSGTSPPVASQDRRDTFRNRDRDTH